MNNKSVIKINFHINSIFQLIVFISEHSCNFYFGCFPTTDIFFQLYQNQDEFLIGRKFAEYFFQSILEPYCFLRCSQNFREQNKCNTGD